VEPDFQRALTVVLGVGSIIMGIATIALAFFFRSFDSAKPRLGLLAGLMVFLLVCCVLFFVLSYAAHW
jgi:uncharacterized membrane protein HdeD (DUF308 family)